MNQRIQIAQTLNDSPSLRTQLAQLAAEAYPLAVLKAAFEPGIPEAAFPETCEWTISEILAVVSDR